jgi:hypothetical protein
MISGTTNTCQIIDNTQFYLSGLTQTNTESINILGNEGLDVSECFGISTNIITVVGDNVTLTGDCNTSLEILITEGVDTTVECLYIDYDEQTSGLILLTLSGGTTTLNVHPECCLALGFEPEIGVDNYYVCRAREECDPNDCDNYTQTGVFEGEYMVFDSNCGASTTIVPSEECCFRAGLILSNSGMHCIIDPPEVDPCDGLTIFSEPDFGDIIFIDASTGLQTPLVPTAECCSSNGFSYVIDGNKYKCYKTQIEEVTVSITNDECCLESVVVVDLGPTGPIYEYIWVKGCIGTTYALFDGVVRVLISDNWTANGFGFSGNVRSEFGSTFYILTIATEQQWVDGAGDMSSVWGSLKEFGAPTQIGCG